MGKTWAELGVRLNKEVEAAVASLNFPTMTPIQAAAIPQLIGKKDVVAEAITGSGKTLAFLVPLLQILKEREGEQKWRKHEIGALVVSPTRELALQIKQVLDQLLVSVSGLRALLLVGGNSVEDDFGNLRRDGGNVVICTPGRFEDLLSRKNADFNLTAALKNLEILILDEADRLLDYGFQKSIDVILSYLPKQRRTGLFSATQTKQVQDLIRAGLRNPVLVSVSVKAKHSTPELLDNYYVIAKNNNKLATLLTFLQSRGGIVNKALLFLPTCAVVDYWSAIFPRLGKELELPILAIHGKMKEKRKRVLERFRKLDKGLLLCTDVLARGIDIPEVDWVLQWDPPSSASAFVHRVGRTARQGRQGSSLLFLLDTEEAYIPFIEKNQRVQLTQLPDQTAASVPQHLTDALRVLQKQDRDLMEKATKAFVSHVRAYSKHECSLLLPIKEFPFGPVASTYGLLQLPKMPELKKFNAAGFDTEEVDTNSIPYKDAKREEARLKKLDVYKRTGEWPGRKVKVVKKKTEAWALSKQRKVDKRERKLKRKGKKRKKSGVSEEDLAELARDVALLKKFKRKKISEEEFDVNFGLSENK